MRKPRDFDRLLQEPLVYVFKHSTLCPVSARANREAEKFLAEHPEQQVYKVEVVEDRGTSNYIAERTGIRHESPQVLLLRDGRVVWHESHFRITADALAAGLVDRSSLG